MRVLGLLGGMSWESTVEYYVLLNRAVRDRRGGQHSARLVLYSVDFDEIATAQHRGDWDRAALVLADGARRLERAGAELALLCTNTMHKVFDEVQAAVGIPFLHIVDATGGWIRQSRFRRVGLLGTRFTMEESFYRERLEAVSDAEVVIPEVGDREEIHRIIFEELCRGVVSAKSRSSLAGIMTRLKDDRAEAIVLGCTELGLLVGDRDVDVPILDTTRIHVTEALSGIGVDADAPAPP
jgi:aspartate racemase